MTSRDNSTERGNEAEENVKTEERETEKGKGLSVQFLMCVINLFIQFYYSVRF